MSTSPDPHSLIFCFFFLIIRGSSRPPPPFLIARNVEIVLFFRRRNSFGGDGVEEISHSSTIGRIWKEERTKRTVLTVKAIKEGVRSLGVGVRSLEGFIDKHERLRRANLRSRLTLKL